MRFTARFVLACFAGVLSLRAQTTQGLISGRILNSVTGRPVAGGSVAFSGTTLAATGTVRSDALGYYFLPLLSAGTYTIRTTADSYQPQELQELELPVAARLNIDFRLRPLNDVWESGQYRSVFLPGTKTIVTFFGPDVDASRSGSFESQKGSRGTLDTSASYVIDPKQIAALPLQGRDVYTMLVSLPGVAADSGTGRGLGVSVAGQRPSASNYLLDGVENDNHLITGPLVRVAPESVQEYRISTNNYSAEYGRTAGFVANAVTRAGGGDYHGLLYEYLKNDVLNATDFADNRLGKPRHKMRENQFGYQFGGPVVPRGALRSRLFFSSSLEKLISHSAASEDTFLLPTTNTIAGFGAPATRIATQLLKKFSFPVIESRRVVEFYKVSPPVVVNRLLALQRGDYVSKTGRDHFSARLSTGQQDQPDFAWTPYPDFITPLRQTTTGLAGNWQRSWTPRVTSETKLSYSDDDLRWDRPHPEIPALAVSPDFTIGISPTLPGSILQYGYRNHNRSIETLHSTVVTRNRHVLTMGGGFVLRLNSGYLTAGKDSYFLFEGLQAFMFDNPYLFRTAIDRTVTEQTPPSYDRSYRYNNSFLFAQDSFRIARRLTVNFGLRYERFAAPSNTGAVKDALLVQGPGNTFDERLAGSKLVAPSSGTQQLFGTDNGNWAPRAGFTWDPFGKSTTLIRGGFGLFYDRPFDNLWQNVRANRYLIPIFYVSEPSLNYLAGPAALLKKYTGLTNDTPGLTQIDPTLKNGYSMSSFLGVQQAIGEALTLDVNFTTAQSRRLISTDVVNRQYTTGVGLGRPQPAFADISWRSSQGYADYYAMGALLRYRLRTLQLQAAYTVSRSIDNQSDPLTGDFFDLSFTSVGSANASALRAAFARQYDASGDRGNSSFDQRHSVFLTGIWSPESRFRIAKGWQAAYMAAFRTGTPFTVLAASDFHPLTGGSFVNQRANLVDPTNAYYANPKAVDGGVQMLNPAAFTFPEDTGPGTSGRNAFRGPGLYNVDVSLSRTFAIPRLWKLRENATLTFRADAFNVLNHANRGNPGNLLGDPSFGVSTYGRQGATTGFPASSPLNDAARTFQILLRAQF
jgi:hypothetical protein